MVWLRGAELLSLGFPPSRVPLLSAGQVDLTPLFTCNPLNGLSLCPVKGRAWLKPEGVLLVTVPAYEFLWSGEDYVSEHRRRYTRRRLSRVFRQAGYEIIKLSYFNTLLFPAQVMTILCQRLFVPRSMYRSHIRPLGSTVNALLTRLMAASQAAPLRPRPRARTQRTVLPTSKLLSWLAYSLSPYACDLGTQPLI